MDWEAIPTLTVVMAGRLRLKNGNMGEHDREVGLVSGLVYGKVYWDIVDQERG